MFDRAEYTFNAQVGRLIEGIGKILEQAPSSSPIVQPVSTGSAQRASIVSEKGGVKLVRIPGGEFVMGSPKDEPGRSPYEGPQHKVRIAEFYLAAHPVTNAQYAQYLEANPEAKKPKFWTDPRFNQPKQPVVGISWDEARVFCDWAGLRLPSEAEWEYACRAGTVTPYWSGSTEADLARVGWYFGNSDDRLHTVGEKEANPFGLFDMHGNVWEWVEDDWHDGYAGAPTNGSAWTSAQRAAEDRVNRGGSFGNGVGDCRSAVRRDVLPDGRSYERGFRPARSIP